MKSPDRNVVETGQLSGPGLPGNPAARAASPSMARRAPGRSTGARLASRASAAATLAWIMNSSIRRCAVSRSGVTMRSTRPSLVDQDLALGKIEIERLAPVARCSQRSVGGPQRLERAFEQRLGLGARTAVDGGLRFLVGQLGGRAHHGAQEGVAASCCRAGRRSCARRGRAGLRPPSASTGRWRSSPAASARRGRGSRPNCRASAPRGRAACRGARSGRRRRSPRARSSRRRCRDRCRVQRARHRRGRGRRWGRW